MSRPADIAHARRTRQVWAELTRCAAAHQLMPSMRVLARRCGFSSNSLAQACFETLTAMEVVEVLAHGEQRRLAGAYRLVKPFGWEVYP